MERHWKLCRRELRTLHAAQKEIDGANTTTLIDADQVAMITRPDPRHDLPPPHTVASHVAAA